jgi:hypothetical protein
VCNDCVHYGSLCIHFILLSIASSQNQTDSGGCHVEGNDVIIYINKVLLDRYFSNNYVSPFKGNPWI